MNEPAAPRAIADQVVALVDHIDRVEGLLGECVPILNERRHPSERQAVVLGARIAAAAARCPVDLAACAGQGLHLAPIGDGLGDQAPADPVMALAALVAGTGAHLVLVHSLLAECRPVVIGRQKLDSTRAAGLALRIRIALRQWPPRR